MRFVLQMDTLRLYAAWRERALKKDSQYKWILILAIKYSYEKTGFWRIVFIFLRFKRKW